jgi:putative transposase
MPAAAGINRQCEVAEQSDCGSGEIGIDLGLATLAALSTGKTIANPRIGRKRAGALARAQRAGRKRRARAIHARIDQARKHEVSTRLARTNGLMVVGHCQAEPIGAHPDGGRPCATSAAPKP